MVAPPPTKEMRPSNSGLVDDQDAVLRWIIRDLNGWKVLQPSLQSVAEYVEKNVVVKSGFAKNVNAF